jgi:hypothetical protein
MKNMLKFIPIFIGASLLSSHADPIAVDFFNYTTGSGLNGASGGIGWSAIWTASGSDLVQATTHSYPGLATSGANAVYMPGGYNSISRPFADQVGRVWVSATINFTQVLSSAYLQFGLYEIGNPNWFAEFGINGANLFTDHSGTGALVNTPFAPTLGTTYMVAFTYSYNGVSPTTIYVNPTGLGSGDQPSGALASASFTGQNWGMNGIGGLSLFANDCAFTLSNIRVGTNWADVSPIPVVLTTNNVVRAIQLQPTVTFTTDLNHIYDVQGAASGAGPWSEAPNGNFPGDGNTHTYTLPVGNNSKVLQVLSHN